MRQDVGKKTNKLNCFNNLKCLSKSGKSYILQNNQYITEGWQCRNFSLYFWYLNYFCIYALLT